jgi:hypothetical protein
LTTTFVQFVLQLQTKQSNSSIISGTQTLQNLKIQTSFDSANSAGDFSVLSIERGKLQKSPYSHFKGDWMRSWAARRSRSETYGIHNVSGMMLIKL